MQKSSFQNLKPVFIFLILTFLLSSIFYFLIIRAGSLATGNGLYTLGLMWCPGISALITSLLLKRKLGEMGWKWGKSKFQFQSYFIPVAYSLLAYAIAWILGWGKFYDSEFLTRIPDHAFGIELNEQKKFVYFLLVQLSLGMLFSTFYAIGEEIGWRGFLVPELYKTQGFTKTSLISGFIWGVWHLPVLIFADYNRGTPVWFSVSCFLVLVLGVSFIYTWLRIKSGSLWTGVLLHASHNLYIQRILNPMTGDTGKTAYFVDEFGILLPLTALGLGLFFWSKRKELSPAQKTN